MASYVDNEDVYEDWIALPEYQNGTYEAFKKAIQGNHPELEESEKGTMAKLTTVTRHYDGVRRSELSILRRFGIAFKREAEKLLQDPALVTNLELSQKYLSTLDGEFEAAVRSKMEGGDLDAIIGQPPAGRLIRRGDRLKYSEVIKIAEHLAEKWFGHAPTVRAGMGNNHDVRSGSVDRRIKQENDDRFDHLSVEMAHVKDALVVQEKMLKTFENSMAETLRVMKQDLQPRGQRNFTTSDGMSAPSGCFFCSGAHNEADCEEKQKYLLNNFIIMQDRRIKLPNGQDLPFYGPGKNKKQRIDEHYRRQGIDTSKAKPAAQMLSELLGDMSMTGSGGAEYENYDTSADEALSANVQRMMARRANFGHSGPTFGQNAGYSQPMNSGYPAMIPNQHSGMTTPYGRDLPPHQPQFAQTAIGMPAHSIAQQAGPGPVGNLGLPKGMDLGQFVQFLDFARQYPGPNGSSSGQDAQQFQILTRRAAKADGQQPQQPNF
uniref:Uncharacterized protein n=1 Tax=Mycena chlorophos TaxID=658473 RepID=A0ABQ0LSK6_MYCCL|nr:predicted protein [Mycena chlorophos]